MTFDQAKFDATLREIKEKSFKKPDLTKIPPEDVKPIIEETKENTGVLKENTKTVIGGETIKKIPNKGKKSVDKYADYMVDGKFIFSKEQKRELYSTLAELETIYGEYQENLKLGLEQDEPIVHDTTKPISELIEEIKIALDYGDNTPNVVEENGKTYVVENTNKDNNSTTEEPIETDDGKVYVADDSDGKKPKMHCEGGVCYVERTYGAKEEGTGEKVWANSENSSNNIETNSGNVSELTTKSEFKRFINKEEITIVDFYQNNCGACEAIKDYYSAKNGIIKGKINLSNNDDMGFNITATPTFIVFKNGKEQERIVGSGYRDLDNLVNNYSY